jgi:hypothetical protein
MLAFFKNKMEQYGPSGITGLEFSVMAAESQRGLREGSIFKGEDVFVVVLSTEVEPFPK